MAIDEYDQVVLQTPKTKQLMFINMNNDLYYPQVVNDWLDWIYEKAEKEGLSLKK